MKIKLDENLPLALVEELGSFGHDVDTVDGEGLAGEPDESVWLAAQQTGRFLITQDLDFSDIRKFAPGSHYGVLLIRLAAPGRRVLFERVRMLFEGEDVGSWKRCFVVAGERKLRIRRPRI